MQDGGDVFREGELMVAAFGELFARHGSGGSRTESAPRDRTRLAAAIGMMKARLSDALSLTDLARPLGLTQYQVISLFKRMTGLPPYAYLTQLRLDAARRRLAAGDAIADAAIACGFYDQSALTTCFKRSYGLTPLQFALAARS